MGGQMSDLINDLRDGVMTLTLNRLEKKNSITTAMYAEMAAALDAARHDEAIRVVVIQGHETVFSAGNDLVDFLNAPPLTPDSPVMGFLFGIASFPKPVIAAVCGPAVGIGTTLLLHCDLVYAGDNAVFSMPFVDLGLCPEAASSLLLPQLLGYHRAAEALLLGEPLLAREALQAGLVNRIVPAREVPALIQAQARRLAAKPIASVIETKRLMKQGQAQQVVHQMTEEAACFARMLREPAAREAFAAFLAKRKPDASRD
jgi:enoyl-CoA hydratase/carnithine racemase